AETDLVARRNRTLAALHDTFERFRVWHTADRHPCGGADETETPWRPSDAASAEGAGGSAGGADAGAGSTASTADD
ncbi:MAG: hypothetical protein ABEL76_16425, partial [Bradymonadaceae bacterium]